MRKMGSNDSTGKEKRMRRGRWAGPTKARGSQLTRVRVESAVTIQHRTNQTLEKLHRVLLDGYMRPSVD